MTGGPQYVYVAVAQGNTAARSRASAEFQAHLAAIRETVELFGPLFLEPVATKQ